MKIVAPYFQTRLPEIDERVERSRGESFNGTAEQDFLFFGAGHLNKYHVEADGANLKWSQILLLFFSLSNANFMHRDRWGRNELKHLKVGST